MTSAGHHGHAGDGDAERHDSAHASPVELRVAALEQLFVDRGWLTTETIDGFIKRYETDIGPLNAPVDSGCRYATRCAHATERCRDVEPPLLPVDGNSLVRCWLFE